MLSAGQRLGSYEVLAPLGAGGMGEVYRARDTRLGREVAIKVLPTELAGDADRLKRFEREARAASSLNHPNIVTVHEVGETGGAPYLVMELVEGKTLRELLAAGGLPARRVLEVAAQVAGGLAKAHEAGLVHRDLKPENLMVTKDGFVKVLDFGLARLQRPNEKGSQLPTATNVTESGVILGTAGYMSPEQARGDLVDFRSDQFSFGTILYEMLAGRRPFRGGSVPETLAAIIGAEPEPLVVLRPETPTALRWIVERCLAKEPEERYAATRDLARDLSSVKEHISEVESGMRPGAARRFPRPREMLAWGLVALAALVATVPALRSPSGARGIPALIRASIEFHGKLNSGLALSPDGSRLAYVGRDSKGVRTIWLRALAERSARSLPGTEGSWLPFWSPDGRSLAFFVPDEAKLKRIDVEHGAVRTVCGIQNGRGGTWGEGDVIVFSPGTLGSLQRVPAAGGTPVAVTQLTAKETTHRFPHFLPGGKRFLYLAMGSGGMAQDESSAIFAGALDGRERTLLVKTRTSMAYAAGHLLYVTPDRVLVAQPFDAAKLRLTGEPVPIAEDATLFPQLWYAPFAVSESGMLVHRSGLYESAELAWLDRTGRRLSSVGPQAPYDAPRLSHDGRRIAVQVTDSRTGTGDIWTYDVERGAGTRVTFDPADDGSPVWTPDDGEIIFSSYRSGGSNLYVTDASRPGKERPLVESPFEKTPYDISLDGRFLLYQQRNAATRYDLWVLSTTGKKEATPFLETSSSVDGARFSPDGRTVAYVTDETGADEVYVRPFPGPGRASRVSTSGGEFPVWSRDGKELFFVTKDKLMSVPVRSSPSFEAGTPVALFEVPGDIGGFDVSPDGQRFIVTMVVQKTPPLSLVLNWTAALRR
jgi:serine/threonine protein kinase/Tol biopolymer transport system component